MNTQIEQAAKILAKYNLTLAPEWTGKINCWHRWHQNDFYLCWLTTYEEYVERIIEIERVKPENEKPLRFLAFHPVKDEVLRLLDLAPAWEAYVKAIAPAWEAYVKATAPAWEAYDKAKAPAREAYFKAISPAWEAYVKATATAWKAYVKAEAEARIKCHFDAGVDIMALHASECADVPIIESTNKLKF